MSALGMAIVIAGALVIFWALGGKALGIHKPVSTGPTA